MFLLYVKITFPINLIILLIFGVCYLARLRNDGIDGEDKMRRVVYAEAMAEIIKKIEPPFTIGIFGRWGSGKSFFLKLIKDNLNNPSSNEENVNNGSGSSDKKNKFKCCIRGVSAILILSICIVCFMWATEPSMFILQPTTPLTNTTNHTTVTADVDDNDQRFLVARYIAFSMFVVLGAVFCVVVCAWGRGLHNWSSEHFHLFLVNAFAKYSKPNFKEIKESEQQFIFVDFNAWEYAGSDRLWAAIATKFASEIEAKFGTVTSRLFQLFEVQYSSSHMRYDGSCFRHCLKDPKTLCHLPTLFWFLLCLIFFVLLPIIVNVAILFINHDIKQTKNPLVFNVTSWLPALCVITIAVIKFVWAMFHSQMTRIDSALAGTKSNMSLELGFMNKVKTEVKHTVDLLNCAAFCHNRQYRVIISIDDLDRCPMEKVKSVLEAVSILLSDSSAPFVCLIAVDSRIAVKCIEETMGKYLLKNNVTGHEYLKKIINLPFSLPKITYGCKERFIEGEQPFEQSQAEFFFTPWLKNSK